MIKCFEKNEIKEKDYNFIISNLILSQEQSFTYWSMLDKLKDMFGEVTQTLERTLSNCLLRLREDGFLNVLGTKYNVIQCDI